MPEIDQFQFPCFVDICTFPHQYCNPEPNERRCNTCDVYICTQDRIPDPCKYFCKARTSTQAPVTEITPSPVLTKTTGTDLNVWLLVYIAALITLLVIIISVLFILVAMSYRRNDKKKSRNRKIVQCQQGSDSSLSVHAGLAVEKGALLADARANMEAGRIAVTGRETGPVSQATRDQPKSMPPPYVSNEGAAAAATNHSLPLSSCIVTTRGTASSTVADSIPLNSVITNPCPGVRKEDKLTNFSMLSSEGNEEESADEDETFIKGQA